MSEGTGAAASVSTAPAAPAQQAATSTPKGVDLGRSAPTKVAPTAAAEPKSATAETKEPTKTAEEFWEVAVDGKPVKMSRAEALRLASLGKKSYQNFEEAAKIRKDAEAKLDRIKTPKDAMRFITDPKNGYDANEVRAAFEEWYSESFIAPESMTAEQKRIAELEKKNREYEESDKERKAQVEAEEAKRLDEFTSKQLQTELTQIIEESGMPKTKFTASRVAYWIRVNEAKGINAPKEMIIQQVKAERGGIVKSLADSSTDDQLVETLGEDVVKRIRRWDLARIRASRGQNPQEQAQKTDKEESRAEQFEKITPREVKRRARTLFK